jgi:hypothetical protein
MISFSLVNVNQLTAGDVYYKIINKTAMLFICGEREGAKYAIPIADPSDTVLLLTPDKMEYANGSAVLISEPVIEVDPSSLMGEYTSSHARVFEGVLYNGSDKFLKLNNSGYWLNLNTGIMDNSAPDIPWVAFGRFGMRLSVESQEYVWGNWCSEPETDSEIKTN